MKQFPNVVIGDLIESRYYTPMSGLVVAGIEPYADARYASYGGAVIVSTSGFRDWREDVTVVG